MEQEVLEYFNNYFGGQLNESTSDEEILEAVYDLVYSTELVLNEIKKAKGGLLQRIWKKIHASRARERQDDAKPLTPKQSKEIIDKIQKQNQQEFDIGDYEESVNLDEKAKRVAKVKDMIKIKLAPGKKIGTRSVDIGPGGKEYNVKTDAEWDAQNEETERERSIRMIEIMAKKKKDYPKQSARARKMLQRIKKTPAVIDGVIQGDRLDKDKFGTGNVYEPDTVQGKPVKEWKETDGPIPQSNPFTVKYAKHRRGEIQTASFDTAEKAKEHLAKVGQEGYKGIVSKDGKPLKDNVRQESYRVRQESYRLPGKRKNSGWSSKKISSSPIPRKRQRWIPELDPKTGKPKTGTDRAERLDQLPKGTYKRLDQLPKGKPQNT